jgi:hypothetical protein
MHVELLDSCPPSHQLRRVGFLHLMDCNFGGTVYLTTTGNSGGPSLLLLLLSIFGCKQLKQS